MNEEKKSLIFEVSQNNFEDLIIHNSNHVPVLVMFMAVWSGPCIKTTDIIAELAIEFPGQFILAKIDIDEQEALKQRFSITNVPTLAVFKEGMEVQREEGELQADELRILLKHYGVFRRSDEIREQAREKHIEGDTSGAIMLLTQAIADDPSNVRVALDMVQIFIDINELEQAESLFKRLGEKTIGSEIGLSISSQLSFKKLANKTQGIDTLSAEILKNPTNNQAKFDLAVCFIAQHDTDQGMSLLFQIHQKDANYQEGAARELIGVVCNMLEKTNPELSATYRNRLANLLSI